MYSSRSWPCVRRLIVRELALEVAAEGEEHRAGVEQAVVVEAVRVHERAAQDAVALVAGPARVGHPDVGVHRGALVELRHLLLAPALERRAGDLLAADRALLGGAREPVPALQLQPDQAHGEVGPAARPVRRLLAGEDQLVAIDAEVLRAVGEAEQPARVGHALALARGGVVLVEALEAGLGPAALEPPLGAAHDVAQRVVGDHRVVGLHEHQQVAVAAAAVEVVARERGHAAERRRPAAGEPEAVVEQRGAERDRDREPAVVAVLEAQLARCRRAAAPRSRSGRAGRGGPG